MMKKHIKKLVSLILSTVMVMGMSVTAFAAENSKSVEVLTDSNEITQVLQEKGIYEDGEDVVAVIQLDIPEPQSIQPYFIFREIYAVYDGSSSGTKASAKYINNYPAGTFHFSQSINTGWQLDDTLGLKIDALEAAIGYSLNRSNTESWTYDSPYYSYPFTVKAYVNYERKYYQIYDKDLIFDDYIGRTSVEREKGYTLKVTRQ